MESLRTLNVSSLGASISTHLASLSEMDLFSSKLTVIVITWSLIVGGMIFVLVLRDWAKTRSLKLPPGPPNWPIVGGLFYLGPIVHKAFAALSKKYGPIFIIRMGMHPVVVLSTAALGEELFKHKDAEFASRASSTITRTSAEYLGFSRNDIAFKNYSDPTFKLLRKLTTAEFLSGTKVAASEKIREEEIGFMLRDIAEIAKKGGTVDIKVTSHTLITNIMVKMLLGRRLYDGQPLAGKWSNFKQLVMEQPLLAAKFNLGDLHPVLGWLAGKSVLREFQTWHKQAMITLGAIIEEHRNKQKLRAGHGTENDEDFVDFMIAFQKEEPGNITDMNIIGLLSDFIVGGNDTTVSSIEWALVELMRSPQCMMKLQEELDRVVGKKRMVKDSDVTILPYLQAVVKESLRLHNPVPVLLPHFNEQQQVLGGYDIPANTTVFFNSYASTRDPAIWKDPDTFNPERFIESDIGLHGSNYEFTPFGSGRRKCPGIGVGLAMLHRSLASLVQAFDWSPGTTHTDISIEEAEGAINKCKHSLVVSPLPRVSSSLYAQ